VTQEKKGKVIRIGPEEEGGTSYKEKKYLGNKKRRGDIVRKKRVCLLGGGNVIQAGEGKLKWRNTA